jgi:predicted RNA-binding Zn-ribbon protein involved in translation (DUF1610 family)
MAETESVPRFSCTQCGGDLNPDQGQLFETCPYCGSTVYLDRSQVVFHWYLSPTLDEREARASLRRWMSGNDTVKDLDVKSKISDQRFDYFPLWQFKSLDGQQERIFLQPAAATSVSELRRLRIPGGDLRKYDHALDRQAVQPSVPYAAARDRAVQQGLNEAAKTEAALVHIPLHTYKYDFEGQTYTALVEAATGQIFANVFPAKAEGPYALAAFVAIGGFLLLALIPIGAALIGGDAESLMAGIGICVGLGIPFSAVSFALASWVAAKI